MNSAAPVFRNPDKVQILPFREWIRLNCPNGKSGLVVEDLDLVPLLFGPMIGRHYNDHGQFMLCEVKNSGYGLQYPQRRLFGMMDCLLRFSDPDLQHYLGFFLIWWDYSTDKPNAINMEPCSENEFAQWIQGKTKIAPYDFTKDPKVGPMITQLWHSLFRN